MFDDAMIIKLQQMRFDFSYLVGSRLSYFDVLMLNLLNVFCRGRLTTSDTQCKILAEVMFGSLINSNKVLETPRDPEQDKQV